MTLPQAPILRFSDLAKAIYSFEELLGDMDLKVAPGSPLEAAALGIEEMDAQTQGQVPHRHGEDYRPRWRQALSLADLALRLLEVRAHPDFPKLRGHFQLLVGNSEVTQFAETPHGNADNDKIFELWASAALLRMMTDCSIDDPHRSKGDNPDFIGLWKGKRWGLAFKAPHSDHPEALIKNIRKGVQQINDCPADAGLVLLNGKNFFPHDAAWPAVQNDAGEFVYATVPDINHVEIMMRKAANYCNWLMCYHAAGGDVENPEEHTIDDLKRGRQVFWNSLGHEKPEQFVLTLWPMIVGATVPGLGVQALSTIKQVTGIEGDAVSAEAKELARSFSLALHGRDPFGAEPALGQ